MTHPQKGESRYSPAGSNNLRGDVGLPRLLDSTSKVL